MEEIEIAQNHFEEIGTDNPDDYLESKLISWLAKVPELWSIFNLVILQPWRTPKNRWRRKTPVGCVRSAPTLSWRTSNTTHLDGHGYSILTRRSANGDYGRRIR
jgi:hypothetical protein